MLAVKVPPKNEGLSQWALVAIGVEAPNSPAGAKYTRAAVKYTALILAAKLAALAAFALKVGPEL